MILDGGPETCPKCNSYVWNFPVCDKCGTNYTEYKCDEMITNLKRFGFEQVIEYHPQNLFQRLFKRPKRVKDSYLRWGKIIARRYKDSSNHAMYFEKKPIGVFNNYGDFDYVSKSLKHLLWEHIHENEQYIQAQKREKLINEII